MRDIPDIHDNDLITVGEAARLLGRTSGLICVAVRCGRLRVAGIGAAPSRRGPQRVKLYRAGDVRALQLRPCGLYRSKRWREAQAD